MSASLQGWETEFSFKPDELGWLENQYHHDHQRKLNRFKLPHNINTQPSFFSEPPPSVNSVPDDMADEPFLDQLAKAVSKRVMYYLQHPEEELMDYPVDTEELETELQYLRNDNYRMATQIQRLLRILDEKQETIEWLQTECSSYRPLLGALHLKV